MLKTWPNPLTSISKGSQENSQEKSRLTSARVLTEAKAARTSWMLSVCLTSIALQSLLACPWDIGHIFHWRVKDWQRVGKGSSEVATGRGKIVPELEIGGEKNHMSPKEERMFVLGSPPSLFLSYFAFQKYDSGSGTFDSQLQRWKSIINERVFIRREGETYFKEMAKWKWQTLRINVVNHFFLTFRPAFSVYKPALLY